MKHGIEPDRIIVESRQRFALTGPAGEHRAIWIRSAEGVELAALDQFKINEVGSLVTKMTKADRVKDPIYSILYSADLYESHMVRSGSIPLGDKLVGSRTSHLSFMWTGIASTGDLKEMEVLLTRAAIDIRNSIGSGEAGSLEWQIAPLVALASATTRRYEMRLRRKRLLFASAFGIYAVMGLVFLLQYTLRL